MKLLAWNLNHRASRRRIPTWIAEAIAVHAPDLVVLTEYVVGPDHGRFVEQLATARLDHTLTSTSTPRQNLVLVASRTRIFAGGILAPPLHPSVPPNFLHVEMADSGLQVLGFRMPAFVSKDRLFKLQTWDWLRSTMASLEKLPTLVVGDFNTAPGDPVGRGGDSFGLLVDAGWDHALPESGYSWRHARSGTERRIDHLFTSGALRCEAARYDWDWRARSEEAASGKVGIPDHAMLIAEVGPAHR